MTSAASVREGLTLLLTPIWTEQQNWAGKKRRKGLPYQAKKGKKVPKYGSLDGKWRGILAESLPESPSDTGIDT